MRKKYILTSVNKEYIPHMGAMFTSILENISDIKCVCLGIIHNDLLESDQEQIRGYFNNKYNVNINFYQVGTNEFSTFPIVAQHLSIETYYRLSIPNLLPDDVEKVIYLDSDIIVRDDILKLWNLETEEYILGAVINPLNDGNVNISTGLGLKSPLDYFNAGVLVINLKQWRLSGFSKVINNFIEKNKESIIYADQDVLNGALNGSWKRIDEKWNLTNNILELAPEFHYQLSQPHENIMESPYLIHYTGKHKPWNMICFHPFKDEYLKYLRLTPWDDEKTNLKEIIIFGTGKMGLELTEELMYNGYEIKCYLDNDNEKKNTLFMGKKVYSPNEIIPIFSNLGMLIIIASQYYEEISEQLNGLGLEENGDYYSIKKIELIGTQWL